MQKELSLDSKGLCMRLQMQLDTRVSKMHELNADWLP